MTVRSIFLKWLKEKLSFLKSWKVAQCFYIEREKLDCPSPPMWSDQGKVRPNFNSKFSANLDFKEFELRPLNLQQIYVPCQIKGALAFQTHLSKRLVFFSLGIIQMFDASWNDLHQYICIYYPLDKLFYTFDNLKTTEQTLFSIHPNICHVFLSTRNFRQSSLVFF